MVGTLKPRWSVLFPQQLSQFEKDMDRLVGRFAGNGNGNSTIAYSPADLWEEEGKWCVEMDLPGVTQDAIEITLEKNVLRIAAVRSAPEGERKYWHQERTYDQLERRFSLPEAVDPEGIEATLENGVLHLILAKKPEAQPKKIEVRQKQSR